MEVFAGQTVGAADISDFIHCEPDVNLIPSCHLNISRDCDFTLDETLAPAVANYL